MIWPRARTSVSKCIVLPTEISRKIKSARFQCDKTIGRSRLNLSLWRWGVNVRNMPPIWGSCHKRQRRKRQPVTAKREKSLTPKVLTTILTLPNLTYTNFGVCDFSRLAVTDWRLRRWRSWFLALSNAPHMLLKRKFLRKRRNRYISLESRLIRMCSSMLIKKLINHGEKVLVPCYWLSHCSANHVHHCSLVNAHNISW